MPEVLQNVTMLLVVGLVALAAVLFVISLFNFRSGRRAPYWRLRRAASLQGWRLFVTALTMMFVAAAIFIFSGLATLILEPTPVATDAVVEDAPPDTPPDLAPEVTATVQDASVTPDMASATVAATHTPTIATPTVAATLTESPSPEPVTDAPTDFSVFTERPATTGSPVATATARPPLPPTATSLAVTPLAASVTPLPAAQLDIVALDSDVDAAFEPVNPRTSFPANVQRIYFWLEYDAMTNGVAWERALWRDAELVQGGAYLWSGGESGRTVFFFGDAEGFAPGNYELRLSLAGEVVAIAMFTVE